MASNDDNIRAAIHQAILLVDEIARITVEDHPYRANTLSALRQSLRTAKDAAFPELSCAVIP
ncbi:hypothetical protein [Paracoccus aminophilus]|uniref:hypothetical protein n=1 Tax=Paracoccus aminophilus TaxID=34003 RepID=UPI000412D2EB|nr:hypothetical protein [Paracoccus aminophilus]